MLSKIPQELIDYIIDFLHNDKETLVHCALTHTTWINTSRYHLFSSILITVRVEAPSSNGYIIPFSSIGDPEHHLERNDNRHDIEKVLQFFKQERYSHCRHYVRHILIRGIVHRGQCTLEVSKIGQILTLLRSVKSLSILSLKLYPLLKNSSGDLPAEVGSFKLKRLVMSDVAAAPIGTLNKQPILDLLSYFSDIDNLLVGDFYAGRTDCFDLKPLPNKVRVSGLSAIRLRDFDLLQTLLLQSICMDTVTSFSSTITHGDHVSATENFLACFVHEKITHLEFDFRWIDLDNEGRVHWNNIDLSTFTAIHSVRVHIPLQFTYGPENLKAAWSIMLALFDKLAMPSLTEISIHFHFSVVRMAADDNESEEGGEREPSTPTSPRRVVILPDQWDAMLEWNKLSEGLQRLKSLRSLHVYVALRVDFGNAEPEPLEKSSFDEVERAIETNLSGLKEKVGLKVSWQQETWPSLTI